MRQQPQLRPQHCRRRLQRRRRSSRCSRTAMHASKVAGLLPGLGSVCCAGCGSNCCRASGDGVLNCIAQRRPAAVSQRQRRLLLPPLQVSATILTTISMRSIPSFQHSSAMRGNLEGPSHYNCRGQPPPRTIMTPSACMLKLP
jgi:hypothetical protein